MCTTTNKLQLCSPAEPEPPGLCTQASNTWKILEALIVLRPPSPEPGQQYQTACDYLPVNLGQRPITRETKALSLISLQINTIEEGYASGGMGEERRHIKY